MDRNNCNRQINAAPRLPWVPIPANAVKTWPPPDLEDYERGWFWTLIFASLAAEPQGYLCNSSNLWMIAGAKRRDFWDSKKSRVLARWEIREVDGIEMICFPPLVAIIDKQCSKLRKPRSSLSLSSTEYQNQRERKPRANGRKHQYDQRAAQDASGLDRLIPD